MPPAIGTVPITLRITHEGITREERLCWDTQNCSKIELEAFAKLYCEENSLPDTLTSAVAETIHQQLQLHSRALKEISVRQPSKLLVVRPCFPLGGKLVQDQFVCDIDDLRASVAEFAELTAREQGWPEDALPEVTWHIHRALIKAGREAAASAEDPARALVEASQVTVDGVGSAAAGSSDGQPQGAAKVDGDDRVAAAPKVQYRVLYPPTVVRPCALRDQFGPQVLDATPELLHQMQGDEIQADQEDGASLPVSASGVRSPTESEGRVQGRKSAGPSRRPSAADELQSPPSSQKGRQQAAVQKLVASGQKIPAAQARLPKRPRTEKPEPQNEPQYPMHQPTQHAQTHLRGRFGSLPGHKPDQVAGQPGGNAQRITPSHLQALQQLAVQQGGTMGQLAFAANNQASYYPVHHQLSQDALDMFQNPGSSLLGHQAGGMLAGNAQLLSQQQRMQQQVAGGAGFGGAANPQMMMSGSGLISHPGLMRSGGQGMSGGSMNIFGGGFN